MTDDRRSPADVAQRLAVARRVADQNATSNDRLHFLLAHIDALTAERDDLVVRLSVVSMALGAERKPGTSFSETIVALLNERDALRAVCITILESADRREIDQAWIRMGELLSPDNSPKPVEHGQTP